MAEKQEKFLREKEVLTANGERICYLHDVSVAFHKSLCHCFSAGDIRSNSNSNNAAAEAILDKQEQRVFVRVPLIGPSSSIPRDVSVITGRWWFPLPFSTTSGSSSTGSPSKR